MKIKMTISIEVTKTQALIKNAFLKNADSQKIAVLKSMKHEKYQLFVRSNSQNCSSYLKRDFTILKTVI